MQAFWKARRVKCIRVPRLQRAADGDAQTGSKCVAHRKRNWFTRDHLPLLFLRSCPRRPAQAPSDPGKLFSRQPARPPAPGSFFVSSAQAVRAVGQPPPTSEARSQAPAPSRVVSPTERPAPVLCHADPLPSFALPPVLSSLGVRPGRGVAPRPEVLRREGRRSGPDPRHAQVFVLLRKRPAARRPSFSGCRSNSGAPSQGGAINASSNFLTLAMPATRPNSATAKRGPLPSSCAHAAQAAAVPRSSRRRIASSVRLRRSPCVVHA